MPENHVQKLRFLESAVSSAFHFTQICSVLHFVKKENKAIIKTHIKSLRECKKLSWVTIFLSILEVVFEIVIPLCMSNLIDLGIQNGAMNVVVKYGIALLIFAAMQLITGFLSARIGAKAGAGFVANLRQDMYDNIQTFSFSNIDKFSTASIVTRLTTDVTNVQNSYQMLIRMAIRVR